MTITDKKNAAKDVIITFEEMTPVRQVENGVHYCDLIRLRMESNVKYNSENLRRSFTGIDLQYNLLLKDAMDTFRRGDSIHPLVYLSELVLEENEVAWEALKGFVL